MLSSQDSTYAATALVITCQHVHCPTQASMESPLLGIFVSATCHNFSQQWCLRGGCGWDCGCGCGCDWVCSDGSFVASVLVLILMILIYIDILIYDINHLYWWYQSKKSIGNKRAPPNKIPCYRNISYRSLCPLDNNLCFGHCRWRTRKLQTKLLGIGWDLNILQVVFWPMPTITLQVTLQYNRVQ